MPLAFASILGGSLTLIGTSTNIVVAAAMPGLGEPSWGLFELTPAALPAVAIGLVYLLTLGRRLLPERAGEVADLYRLREYVSEVVVPAGSPWVDRTLYELAPAPTSRSRCWAASSAAPSNRFLPTRVSRQATVCWSRRTIRRCFASRRVGSRSGGGPQRRALFLSSTGGARGGASSWLTAVGTHATEHGLRHSLSRDGDRALP